MWIYNSRWAGRAPAGCGHGRGPWAEALRPDRPARRVCVDGRGTKLCFARRRHTACVRHRRGGSAGDRRSPAAGGEAGTGAAWARPRICMAGLRRRAAAADGTGRLAPCEVRGPSSRSRVPADGAGPCGRHWRQAAGDTADRTRRTGTAGGRCGRPVASSVPTARSDTVPLPGCRPACARAPPALRLSACVLAAGRPPPPASARSCALPICAHQHSRKPLLLAAFRPAARPARCYIQHHAAAPQSTPPDKHWPPVFVHPRPQLSRPVLRLPASQSSNARHRTLPALHHPAAWLPKQERAASRPGDRSRSLCPSCLSPPVRLGRLHSGSAALGRLALSYSLFEQVASSSQLVATAGIPLAGHRDHTRLLPSLVLQPSPGASCSVFGARPSAGARARCGQRAAWVGGCVCVCKSVVDMSSQPSSQCNFH